MLAFLCIIDERTRGWLLVDSPKPTLLYTALYLFIVWSGPKLMRQRKAFKLTWALVPYNLAMAALNLYIAVEVFYTSIQINFHLERERDKNRSNVSSIIFQLFVASTKLNYSYVCQPIRHITRPEEMQVNDDLATIWL